LCFWACVSVLWMCWTIHGGCGACRFDLSRIRMGSGLALQQAVATSRMGSGLALQHVASDWRGKCVNARPDPMIPDPMIPKT
jgi:hypothetical protein